MQRLGLLFAVLALAALAGVTATAAPPKGINATDLSMVGDDYAFQGEYTGTWEAPDGDVVKLGAQVIAGGKGTFSMVVYIGGLPGDGWKRGDGQELLEGKKEGDTVVFKNANGDGVIKGKQLTLKHKQYDNPAVLKPIERKSPTLGAKPPEGAMVLFDGTGTEQFVEGTMNEAKLLWAGATTKPLPNSYTMHMEFLLPYMPEMRGQGRSNSGVYLHDCYEMQVLDSFGLEGKDNECGGFYKLNQPDVNMCLPPLVWQTYDIDFTGPKFDADGKRTAQARVSVRHNGVVIHDDLKLEKTPGRQEEGPGPRGIHLQAHGNKVQYRNIWLVEKK